MRLSFVPELSIINTGNPPRRTRGNGSKEAATTANAGTSSGAKLCFCGESAMRLQVKKEVSRHYAAKLVSAKFLIFSLLTVLVLVALVFAEEVKEGLTVLF